MAQPAGIVNDGGRDHDEAFSAVLAPSSAAVNELARAVRDLVYDVLPATVEVVWPRQGSVGWGVGPKKFTEQFAYLMAYTGHVTLGFYHGGELPDPEKLLREAGGRQVGGSLTMRSLKIQRLDDVARPAMRALVDAAVRHQSSLLGR